LRIWTKNAKTAKLSSLKVIVLAIRKYDIYYFVLLGKVLQPCMKNYHCFSFPGGRVDKEDKSIEDTALRETSEELGIHPEQVEIWTSIVSTKQVWRFSSNFPHSEIYALSRFC